MSQSSSAAAWGRYSQRPPWGPPSLTQLLTLVTAEFTSTVAQTSQQFGQKATPSLPEGSFLCPSIDKGIKCRKENSKGLQNLPPPPQTHKDDDYKKGFMNKRAEQTGSRADFNNRIKSTAQCRKLRCRETAPSTGHTKPRVTNQPKDQQRRD